MKKHAEMVEAAFPDAGNKHLRARLIWEETKEGLAELGYVVDKKGMLQKRGVGCGSDAAIVKECCDIHVVTTGTMLSLGLTPEDISVCQQIVDENNMLKAGRPTDEHGKVIKADDHPSAVPVIAEYLDEIVAIRDMPDEMVEALTDEPRAGDYDLDSVKPPDVSGTPTEGTGLLGSNIKGAETDLPIIDEESDIQDTEDSQPVS